MRHGVQGLLKDEVIDLTEALDAPGKLSLLRHTPASYLGSCRYKLPESGQMEAVYQAIFDALRRYDIGYFFYIGGNDSMDTILKLSDYAAKIGSDIRFVGVPKTIDNDLTHTDHTPGYGSAAKYIGTTIKELVRDSTIYDLKSVTVVEIMGRNAGWLTAAAALAEDEDCEGAAMICLPEVRLIRSTSSPAWMRFSSRRRLWSSPFPRACAQPRGATSANWRITPSTSMRSAIPIWAARRIIFPASSPPGCTAKPAPSSFPPFSVVPRTSPVKPTFPNRSTWARSPWTQRLRAKPA